MTDDDGSRLELYKLAVEMADRTTARRAGANSFFLTLHAALAALVGVLSAARRPPTQGDLPRFDSFGLVATAVSGVVLSLTWWALLRYYRRLNRAKFDVINDVETRLVEKPFTDEWRRLHPGEVGDADQRVQRWWARWWRRNRHREASAVEQIVPFLFAAIYVALAVRLVIQ